MSVISGIAGLTSSEVIALIGRGKAGGTVALNAVYNIEFPGDTISSRLGNPAAFLEFLSSNEPCFKAKRLSANNYQIEQNENNVYKKLLSETDRNGATTTGVAGIYNPCKTILNEHRPVCTKEYHLVGKYLDGADNPDVWFPIPGAGGGTVVYANRFLTLTSGTGAANSATRCVIDQTKFPISGNFIEVTCRIGATVLGADGVRLISFGFQPGFNMYYGGNTDRAIFTCNANGYWSVGGKDNDVSLTNLPLGRNLQPGDICTVRLGRQEGSPDIDIARFYVNGQKQYETLNIPTQDCYAGIGVFSNSFTTTPISIAIDYFGCKFVP